jgi:hypothetical protein
MLVARLDWLAGVAVDGDCLSKRTPLSGGVELEEIGDFVLRRRGSDDRSRGMYLTVDFPMSNKVEVLVIQN